MPFRLSHTKHRTFELDLPLTTRFNLDILDATLVECITLAELLNVHLKIQVLDKDHFIICSTLAAGLLEEGAHVYTTLQLDVKTDATVDDEEIRLALNVAFQTYGTVMSPSNPFEVHAINMGRPLTERCALFDSDEKTVHLFGKRIEYVTPPVSPIPPRQQKHKKQRICMGF